MHFDPNSGAIIAKCELPISGNGENGNSANQPTERADGGPEPKLHV